MKTLILALLGLSILHAGASKLPSGIYSLDNLQEATAKAQESNLPMVFISGLLSSSCPTVQYMVTGTHGMFRALKKDAVIVYLSGDWQKSPALTPWLLGAFSNDKFSNKPPHLVFTSPDQSTIYTIFGDDDVADKSEVKKIKEKLAKIHSGEIPPDDFPRTSWMWQSSKKGKGAHIGEFVKLVNNTDIHVRASSGKVFLINGSNLVPHHLEIARKLSRGEDPTKIAAPAKPVTWQSTNGKAIKATFIALKDEDLTLKLENGKLTTVHLSKLTEESIQLAKTTASQSNPAAD